MDDDLKKKLYWIFVVLMTIVAIYTFTSSYFYDKDRANATVAVARQEGIFKLLNFSNSSKNFTVDVQDVQTQQIYNTQFITANCPLYQKNQIGSLFKMYKVTNMNVNTGEKSYSFDGGYDFLCTNKKISDEDNKTLAQ